MTDILQYLTLSPSRLQHTLGVREAALMIAHDHFPELCDDDVATAALMHDFTKEYTLAQQEAVCAQYGDTLSPLEYASPALIHSHTAALIAERRFGFSPAICKAIASHTTGSDDMTPLDICIYLGDYIDANRSGEYCKKVRQTYLSLMQTEQKTRALYDTLLLSFDMTIRHLLDDGCVISDATVRARNAIITKLKEVTK